MNYLIIICSILLCLCISINSVFANSVIKTIPIIGQPEDLVFNPLNGYIYLTNSNPITNKEYVTVIDTKTNQVIDNIAVGFNVQRPERAMGIEFNPNNNYIYAVIGPGIFVIDGNTNRLIDNIRINTTIGINDANLIPIAGSPLEIIYNPNNNKLYTTVNALYNDTFLTGDPERRQCDTISEKIGPCLVSVIDGKTNRVIDNILSGYGIQGITIDQVNNLIYVANQISKSVSIINATTNKVIDDILINSGQPIDVIFEPNKNKIYVTDGYDKVIVIDSKTNKVIRDIQVELAPMRMTLNPNNNKLYVTNAYSNTISVIDTQTDKVIDKVLVGQAPIGIVYNPNNNNLYVSNKIDNSLSVISTCNNVTNIKDNLKC